MRPGPHERVLRMITTTNQRVHQLEILEVIQETPDAMSIVFAVPDDAVPKFRYAPGQFITLKIPSEQTGSVARCYSLSSSPHLDDDLIVTVKRTDRGYASNWLCDNAAPGMVLTVLSPSGVFVPKSLHTELLLVAAGSGVTPIASIAKSALVAGTAMVHLVYANRDRDSVIFGAEFDDMLAEFPGRFTVLHWLESERGLPTESALTPVFAAFTRYQAYVCGPEAFMKSAGSALRAIGMADKHIHVEHYQSLAGDPFADIVVSDAVDGAATAVVELAGQTVELDWPRETPLLDLLLSRGYDPPYSCREGACSSCACTVRSGEVRMLRNDTLVEADLAAGLTLACQAVPHSARVEIAFDQ